MNFKQNARKACYFHRSILKNYFIRVPLQIKLYLIYTNIPRFYIVSLDNPDSTTNRRVWMKSSKSLDEVFIKMISLEDVVTHKNFFFHYLRSKSSFFLVRWWMTWIIFGVVIAISYRPINFGKPRMGQNVVMVSGLSRLLHCTQQHEQDPNPPPPPSSSKKKKRKENKLANDL